ncbi:hypothetical protein RD792_007836 [Penstemon davidsonii]|uniref:MADS-box domain-containing protein n=1 Tax=Penstemon davidsonii TaxID=160366 RepID=A0ABR0D7G6_9LAMI|nr:hypothetical protein RD792_007836 [Penstemon davidsonii]
MPKPSTLKRKLSFFFNLLLPLFSMNADHNDPPESNHFQNKSARKRKGRQKLNIEKIENENNLQVTFSKRRVGLFKKASELATLTGAELLDRQLEAKRNGTKVEVKEAEKVVTSQPSDGSVVMECNVINSFPSDFSMQEGLVGSADTSVGFWDEGTPVVQIVEELELTSVNKEQSIEWDKRVENIFQKPPSFMARHIRPGKTGNNPKTIEMALKQETVEAKATTQTAISNGRPQGNPNATPQVGYSGHPLAHLVEEYGTPLPDPDKDSESEDDEA